MYKNKNKTERWVDECYQHFYKDIENKEQTKYNHSLISFWHIETKPRKKSCIAGPNNEKLTLLDQASKNQRHKSKYPKTRKK